MNKVIIFGNSGSGKSTLAKQMAIEHQLTHLDLDTLAWQATDPPTRKPLTSSQHCLELFISEHTAWVIEGCYADILSIASKQADSAIFMDLPVTLCQHNAKNRPWEPHKYTSESEQDANLPMLLDWIADYPVRKDEFSHQAHLSLYQAFTGSRQRILKNQPCVPLIG